MTDQQTNSQERTIPARFNLARVGLAVLVALVLYGGVYAYVESLARAYGDRNPFHKVATVRSDSPALLIVGASHALPLVYDGMNAVVEERLGMPVVNLAMQGGGVVPNRLLIDYFLREHGAASVSGVVYVLDSFVFDSAEWNEERLVDNKVWQKAPLDRQLIASLWSATRTMNVSSATFWNYASGFLKVNDPASWRQTDVWPDESKFDDAYSPNRFQERARITYLFPRGVSESVRSGYEQQFRELARELAAAGVPLVVVAPPLRDAFLDAIPSLEEREARVRALMDELGVTFHDFSRGGYEDALFLDPDHLNRAGALRFLEQDLAPVVEAMMRSM